MVTVVNVANLAPTPLTFKVSGEMDTNEIVPQVNMCVITQCGSVS